MGVTDQGALVAALLSVLLTSLSVQGRHLLQGECLDVLQQMHVEAVMPSPHALRPPLRSSALQVTACLL